MVHEVEQGRIGEKHQCAKYSNDLVEMAREMRDDGLKPAEIRERLPVRVPKNTIKDWIYYRTRIFG